MDNFKYNSAYELFTSAVFNYYVAKLYNPHYIYR